MCFEKRKIINNLRGWRETADIVKYYELYFFCKLMSLSTKFININR